MSYVSLADQIYEVNHFFMKDNSLEDWRITLSSKKILWILLELVVCLIHPFPTGWGSNIEYSDGSVVCLRLSTMDIVLSIMMFLRLYQIHRVILLHSNFLVNASYRSIGSLNKVKLNFRFILKVLMDTSPGKVLLVIIICLWLLTSWTLSLCERQFIDEINVNKTGSQFFFEAAYLVPITFLTIGYGDIVPVTVCGKMVCLFTGVMGVGCTALLVAVAANKLQLNKAQKYVLNFMHNIQYKKQIEAAAATVLQLRWRLYKVKRRNSGSQAQIRRLHRKLLSSIKVFQRAKWEKRKLQDQASSMLDISTMEFMLEDLNNNLNRDLEKRLNSFERKLDNLTNLIVNHHNATRGSYSQTITDAAQQEKAAIFSDLGS
nr:PREDICTED: intermediate conductance calcium-activated potassium channel protein 4-like [Latimeria chalumnae]|eukprot:XP_014343705.1 PREDICTED: intermediate conductance calcium-activated potassium channel protein 4-like [Latimeria chalumnae]